MIKPGRYRHFKGNDYQVIDVARHTETEEWFVVYRCCYGDYSMWVRPLEDFMATVELNGETVSRFSFMDDQV